MTRALKATIFAATTLSAASFAQAELVTYTIVPAQSSLTVTGSLTDNTASQQTPGSLTTSYSGTIIANRNPGLIEFPGGSLAAAANLATQQEPDDDALPGDDNANYGRTAPGPFGSTTLEAIRGLAFDIFDDSSGLGIPIVANNFASTSLEFVLDGGESDASFGTGFNPDIDLSGKNTGNGAAGGQSSVVLVGMIETLTLKFNTGPITYNVFQAGDSSLIFNGQIVATRTVIPEPAAIGVIALGGLVTATRRKRRG